MIILRSRPKENYILDIKDRLPGIWVIEKGTWVYPINSGYKEKRSKRLTHDWRTQRAFSTIHEETSTDWVYVEVTHPEYTGFIVDKYNIHSL